MKRLLLAACLALPILLPAQTPDTLTSYGHTKDKLEPTAREVLLKVLVLDFTRQKVPGMEVRVLQEKTGRVWRGYTGSYGEVFFLLPKGQDYRVDAGAQEGLRRLSLPNKRDERVSCVVSCAEENFQETARGDTLLQRVSAAQMPSRDRVFLHLKMLDLDDRPLDAEVMYFAVRRSGKIYVAQTNPLGDAYLMLPKGENYCISTRFDTDMKCFDMPQNDRAGKLTLTINTIGTQAILKRQAERARQLAIRDSIFEARRIEDSIRQAQYALRLLLKEDNFLSQLGSQESPDSVRLRIDRRAAKDREGLARDEHYFEKKREEVNAVLYRMRQNWKNKVIVTDVTCSMAPYLDQVILWHALQLVQGAENRYIFFNDGDGKGQEQKIAGKTGGLHFTEQVELPQLLDAMRHATSFGCSGDGPENDLEALLGGADKLRGMDELVLIADNYSDVRDIELLSQLKVPVRIILCGTEFGANEEYLHIAWKTGGSVHTIEQDIDQLAQLANGATIKIGKYEYRVSRGNFIQINRL